MTDYEKTHLCGHLYGDDHCRYLLYATKYTDIACAKRLQKLKKNHVYCIAENRCRSMGCAAKWTGLSPKWCPKRIEMEASGDA